MDVDRHHFGRIQKGMAAIFNVQIAVCVEERFAAPVMSGQSGLGKDKIQLCQELLICADLLHMWHCLIA